MSISFVNNKPFLEEVLLNELIQKVQTPFYIYSQKAITDAYTVLKNNLGTNIFFSVISLPSYIDSCYFF